MEHLDLLCNEQTPFCTVKGRKEHEEHITVLLTPTLTPVKPWQASLHSHYNVELDPMVHLAS